MTYLPFQLTSQETTFDAMLVCYNNNSNVYTKLFDNYAVYLLQTVSKYGIQLQYYDVKRCFYMNLFSKKLFNVVRLLYMYKYRPTRRSGGSNSNAKNNNLSL